MLALHVDMPRRCTTLSVAELARDSSVAGLQVLPVSPHAPGLTRSHMPTVPGAVAALLPRGAPRSPGAAVERVGMIEHLGRPITSGGVGHHHSASARLLCHGAARRQHLVARLLASERGRPHRRGGCGALLSWNTAAPPISTGHRRRPPRESSIRLRPLGRDHAALPAPTSPTLGQLHPRRGYALCYKPCDRDRGHRAEAQRRQKMPDAMDVLSRPTAAGNSQRAAALAAGRVRNAPHPRLVDWPPGCRGGAPPGLQRGMVITRPDCQPVPVAATLETDGGPVRQGA